MKRALPKPGFRASIGLLGVMAVCALSALCACGSSSNSDPSTTATPPQNPKNQSYDGPDLIVDQDSLASSVEQTTQDFDLNSCEVIEGCVSGTGTRKLLLFDAGIINVGNQDLVLGDPATNPNYKYSPCHQHYHLQNMMLYALLNPKTGQVVTTGTAPVVVRKQGFCLEDSNPVTSTADAKYDCDNQGLSIGWEDMYDTSVDCQWLDVTNVPPGNYILQLTVNPDHVYPDTNLNNNVAETPVTIN